MYRLGCSRSLWNPLCVMSMVGLRDYLISCYHIVVGNIYHLILFVTSIALFNCFSISFNAYNDAFPCPVHIMGLGADDLVTTETRQGILQSDFQSFGTAIACVVVCVPTFIDTLLDMIPSNVFSFCYNDRRPVLKLKKAEIIRMTHFERMSFIVGVWMIAAAEIQNAFIGNKFSIAWSSRLVVSFNSGATILIFTPFLLFAYRVSTFFTPMSSLIISILLCCSQTLSLAAYRRGFFSHNCPSSEAQKKSILYARICGFFLAAFIIVCVIKGLFDILVVDKKKNKMLSSYQTMEKQVRNSIIMAHVVSAFIGLIYHMVAASRTSNGAPIISDDPQAILKYRIICLIMAAIVFVTEFRCRKNEVTRSLYEAMEVKKKYIHYLTGEIKAPLNVAFLGIRALRDNIQKFPSNRDDLKLEIVQEIQHGCLSVSQVINGLLRLEQLELLDHMPSLCETQLVKQTKSLHSFLEHCVTSVTTQHAQERNVEMYLNCSPTRLDVDNDIILPHDENLLMELMSADVITADQTSLRQAIRNVLSHAVAATPVGGTVTIQAAFIANLQPTMSKSTTNPTIAVGGSSSGAVLSRYSLDAANDTSSMVPSHDPMTYPPRPSTISTESISPWNRLVSFFRGTDRRPFLDDTNGDTSGGVTEGVQDGRRVVDSSALFDMSCTRFMENPSLTSNTNNPHFNFNYRSSVDCTRYPMPAADDHDHGLAPSNGRDMDSPHDGDNSGGTARRRYGNVGEEDCIDNNVALDYDDKTSMSSQMVSGRLVIQVMDGGHACYDAEGLLKLFDEDRYDNDDDDDKENELDTNRQGLWITKAIVEMHGGKVSAMTSEAGGGTILTIQLPMKRCTNVDMNLPIDGLLTNSPLGNTDANNRANASLLHRLRSKSSSVFSSCDHESVTITAAERRLHQLLSHPNNPGQIPRVNLNFSQMYGSSSRSKPCSVQNSVSINTSCCMDSQQGGNGSLLAVDGKFSPPADSHRWLDVECGHGIDLPLSVHVAVDTAVCTADAGTVGSFNVRKTMEVLQQGRSEHKDV